MLTEPTGHFARSPVRVRSCAAAILAAFAASAMLTGLAKPAGAIPRAVKRACKDDYKRFCPRYKLHTARLRACMRANGSQLSWRCYEALRDHGYVRRYGGGQTRDR